MASISIPAPTGGWNARDSRDQMPQTDAVKLVNWIPRNGYCETRKGRQSHVTGLGGTVESVIAYRGPGSAKLLAAANGELWDVSTAGAPASLKTGLSSDLWQYTHHSGKAILTNGIDTPQVYDGATLTDIVITGVTASTLWGVNNYKGRLFYWAQNSQSFWYAAAASYQGALTEFKLERIAKSGGSIVQMVTWTLDAGDGVNDLAAFVMSTGEVIIYQGDDPGDATAWALTGSFSIGEPIGIRSHARVAGTEIIATKDGYLDLAEAIKGGRYNEQSAYSFKIIQAAKAAAKQYAGNTGWACLLYPAGNLFLVNVPISATESVQHVRDTTNGGWTQFQGWPIRSFAVHQDSLYFGDPDGNVWLADTTATDGTSPIYTEAVPAFNTLGSRASQKQVTAVSIVSSYRLPKNWVLDGLADFNLTTRAALNAESIPTDSAWDFATWDADAWGDDTNEPMAGPRAWRNVRAVGYSVTCSIRLNLASQPVVWFSTAYLFRPAGVI